MNKFHTPKLQQHSHPLWCHISQALSEFLNTDFEIVEAAEVSGGDINTSFVVSNGDVHYFAKLLSARHAHMHQSEAFALDTLIKANALRCPTPLVFGAFEDFSYLVMEYLPLKHAGNEYALGKQLAKLHKKINPAGEHCYGLEHNNFIGLTPQKNAYKHNWQEFWASNRLQPQIEMAMAAGYPDTLKQKTDYLIANMGNFFDDYTPPASLLHGDLWSGNKAFCQNEAVIFDPAVYYGDRETDIALTELFGGFSQEFYTGYSNELPLSSGYSKRKNLYNLYHQLNHLNLFGGSYLSSCQNTLNRLLTLI